MRRRPTPWYRTEALGLLLLALSLAALVLLAVLGPPRLDHACSMRCGAWSSTVEALKACEARCGRDPG